MSYRLKLLTESQHTRLKFFEHLKEDDDHHNTALRELAEERYWRMVAERAFDNEWIEIDPEVKSQKFDKAAAEIDAELAKKESKENG